MQHLLIYHFSGTQQNTESDIAAVQRKIDQQEQGLAEVRIRMWQHLKELGVEGKSARNKPSKKR